jgi:hypothetical protein
MDGWMDGWMDGGKSHAVQKIAPNQQESVSTLDPNEIMSAQIEVLYIDLDFEIFINLVKKTLVALVADCYRLSERTNHGQV